MIDGDGEPFGLEAPKYDLVMEEAPHFGGNIMFTTTEAFAGSTVSASSFAKEENTFFSIPGLTGASLVAFPINGNSMEPGILDGDMVICREISGLHEIRDNKIYAIKNNGQLWVKYVQRVTDSRGRVTHLKLISANHLEHDPFVEEVGQYTRLYEVVRRISDL